MPESRRIVYWDACAFLSYINDITDRIPILEALLDGSARDNGAIKIYTSTLSAVEVAFAASEQKQQTLHPQVEQQLDNLWADPGAVVSVEFHDGIGGRARKLMRDGIAQGWNLKPNAAIHLAPAHWLYDVGIPVDEFHTYDTGLPRYAAVVDFKILAPYTPQPRLL